MKNLALLTNSINEFYKGRSGQVNCNCMRIFSIVCVCLLQVSCVEHVKESQVYGYYTPLGYRNTFDTIHLMSNSVYHRKVYDQNNKLVLEMDGRWNLERASSVHFVPFYLNLDDDLVQFPHSVDDTSGGWGGSLKTINGKIRFCVGHYVDSNCYQKLE